MTISSRPARPRLTWSTFPWKFFRAALLLFVAVTLSVLFYAWLRPLELLFSAALVNLRFQGIHSRYVTIDGHRIHYFTGGSGQPIVLVHGLGGRSEDWTNLMPQLIGDHRQVYALDLLGYGRSDKPGDAAYSISQEARLVESFIDAEHLALNGSQTDLAGWSMGGWIAARVALDQPRRIRRLILFDSAGVRFDLHFDPTLFAPDTPQRLTTLNNLLNPVPPPPIPAFIQRDIFRNMRENGWIIRRSIASMLTQQDLLDGKLGALPMPVLLAWGKQDHIIPPAAAEAMHKEIPQSVLEIFDGCGHLAPRQCTARIGPKTIEFLDATPPLPAQTQQLPIR